MPALHIRDISDTLMRRLKSDAALNGITLMEHVINQLGGEKTKDRVSEDLPRPAQVPVVTRDASRSERVPALGQAGRKCLCGDTWEEHWEGGRCRAERCKCGRFEEG